MDYLDSWVSMGKIAGNNVIESKHIVLVNFYSVRYSTLWNSPPEQRICHTTT